ncbi:MAG: putative membrane protein [Myxococcota bacterium]|jgi:uncharacterized membrane protein
MIFLLLACSDKGTDSAPPVSSAPEWCAEEVDVTYDNFGEGFLLTHCQGCHAQETPNRFGAPESVYFDTRAEVDVWRDTIYRVVFTDLTMPPAGGITDDELSLADIWLQCDL